MPRVRDSDRRWDNRVARTLSTLALGILFWFAIIGASFPIQFTVDNLECTACWNDTTRVCRPEDSGLAFIRVMGVRYRDMDTLTFGDIPYTGKDSIFAILDIDSTTTTMGQLWAIPYDRAGNKACAGSWVTFTVPYGEPGPVIPPGLSATLYIGTDLTIVAATRVDSTINFNWGDGPLWPGGSSDNVSIRWVGFINIPTTGDWTIYVGSDDGRRAWLGGPQILFGWGPRWDEQSWTGPLTVGRHPFVLEYEEIGGGALCKLYWSGPDVLKSLVPSSALSH